VSNRLNSRYRADVNMKQPELAAYVYCSINQSINQLIKYLFLKLNNIRKKNHSEALGLVKDGLQRRYCESEI